jgi:transcriptional regulator with XRE-family HTH domain
MDDRFVLPDGQKIRRIRQEHFWSQEQLADKAGPRKRTIERAEAGERLQRSTLGAIAQALGLPAEGLVSSGGSSEPRHDGPSTSRQPSNVPPVVGRIIEPDLALHEGGQAHPSQAETSTLSEPERCSGCGVENPPGMKFCTACGLAAPESLPEVRSGACPRRQVLCRLWRFLCRMVFILSPLTFHHWSADTPQLHPCVSG